MRSGSRAVALLGAFVTVSVVAGLLLAGLALPAAWATGAATRGGVDYFNSLPDELAEPPLSEQSTVLDASGRPIAHFYDERRILVPLSNISQKMQDAIIAIEDSRFYQHGGVDPKGLLRAFVNNQVTDGQVQGASTLTQQYIKLRIFEAAVVNDDAAGQTAALSQNYTRKLQEVRMAISLEKRKTKKEILADYLNIANFGDSTYGVEAAAEYFFNRTTAAKLTLPQAALLAGLVQSPQRYNPFQHPEAAQNRRNIVLSRMHDLGTISDADYTAAVKSPLGVKRYPPKNGCITSAYAYFCSYVRNLIAKSNGFSALGKTEAERATTLKRGGLLIRTTLKGPVQDAAQEAVNKRVPIDNSTGVGSSAVTVEPGTGKVLAMVQNRVYDATPKLGHTEINYGVDGDLGSGYGFQTGSTFKSFVLATWLAKGKGLYDVVDASDTTRSPSEFESCKGRLGGGPFKVFNSESSEGGQMTVLEATSQSVNVAYMDMATKLSLCDIKDVATKLGVHKAHVYDAGECQGQTTALPDCTPSMVLGSVDVAPLTMAAAYAAFAADGKYCTPMAVTSITDRDHKPLKVPGSSCTDALDSNVAHGVTFALKQVLTRGTAAGLGIGRPAAGKTGTTDDFKDTWFVGYTPQLSTAVWVGDNPNPAPGDQRSSLRGRKIGDRTYGSVFGATIAAPIWQTIMKKGSEGLPSKDWPNPTGKVLSGSSVKMPDVRGQSVEDAKASLEAQGFDVTIGDPVPSDFGPDKVESTSPPAGARVSPKSKVTIHPGNGEGGGGDAGDGEDKNGDGKPDKPDKPDKPEKPEKPEKPKPGDGGQGQGDGKPGDGQPARNGDGRIVIVPAR
jgi:membrane peptidoglycan carboxypeptidase